MSDPDRILAREAATERALAAWERECWLVLFRAEIGGRLAERLQVEAHESLLAGWGPMPEALLEEVTEAILRSESEEREPAEKGWTEAEREEDARRLLEEDR